MLLKRGDRVVIVDEMNAYYDVRLKQANLEYLIERHGSKVVIYRGGNPSLLLLSSIPFSFPLRSFLSFFRFFSLSNVSLLSDICDLDFISKVFEKERPTHVCHMAGEFPSFFPSILLIAIVCYPCVLSQPAQVGLLNNPSS